MSNPAYFRCLSCGSIDKEKFRGGTKSTPKHLYKCKRCGALQIGWKRYKKKEKK